MKSFNELRESVHTESADDSIKQFSDYLNGLSDTITKAQSELSKGNVGKSAQSVAAMLVRFERESFYRKLFK